jgi:SAM-dependent methyltransferase
VTRARPVSPYEAPGFYDRALAEGRHRDIVGGRWDETGRAQMALLQDAGLRPGDRLLDIGAGSLRLGCKAVRFLDPGHYWATDASGALMRRGWDTELTDDDRARLPVSQLVEDQWFEFPDIPGTIDIAIAFAVFTHLPVDRLANALDRIGARFPALRRLVFTVFLRPGDHPATEPFRQADGVVTHTDRAPYHFTEADILRIAAATGWRLVRSQTMLPRGQVAYLTSPLTTAANPRPS